MNHSRFSRLNFFLDRLLANEGDGSDMPSGMYFCSLETGGTVSSDRMLLLR
jgi:hypothetical protein